VCGGDDGRGAGALGRGDGAVRRGMRGMAEVESGEAWIWGPGARGGARWDVKCVGAWGGGRARAGMVKRDGDVWAGVGWRRDREGLASRRLRESV